MSHSHTKTSSLALAFALNLGFTVIEAIGGILTNSMAILSDALHDAGDCISLGISWYLQKLSKQEANQDYSYGYRRYSVLGAAITGVVLVVGMLIVLSRAIPRLVSPEPVDSDGMLALAILGITVNGWAAYRAGKGTSLNEGIVSWHLIEDVLGWVAVLFGSFAIKIWNIPIIDPILSIVISLFILANAVRQLSKVFGVFLQRVPEGFNSEQFRSRLLTLDRVRSTHHVHSWSLDGEEHVLTAHIVVEPATSIVEINDLKEAIRNLAGPHFAHLTIEVEHEGASCSLFDSPPPKSSD